MFKLKTEEIALDCTLEKVEEHYQERLLNDLVLSSYIPPQYHRGSEASYRRLLQLDDQISNGGDYELGSARRENDIQLLPGSNNVMLTAEHATDHIRMKADGTAVIYKKARDFATGAIALAAAYDSDSSALIALGRQTGDANRDIDHPLKQEMTRLITDQGMRGPIAVHGMGRGLAANIRDKRGYSIQVGIGAHPSEVTRTWVHDEVVPLGKDMGLVVGVNDRHIRFPKKKPMLSDDGKRLVTRIYGGSGEISGVGETTRDHAQKIAKELNVDDGFIAAQFEINSVLRWHPDTPFLAQADKVLGAHIGYLFVKLAAQKAAWL